MFQSDIPKTIIAGTTVEWVDEATTAGVDEVITSTDWTLEYYLRTNTASEGLTTTGTQYQNTTGWKFTITSTQSNELASGIYYWAARAFKSGKVFEIGNGQLEVKQSLQYSGTPSAIDNRTQAEKDLETVQAAIRTLTEDKAAEYSIGNRRFKRQDLATLITRESQLKSIVFSERRASMIAQGLGDPKTMFVRF